MTPPSEKPTEEILMEKLKDILLTDEKKRIDFLEKEVEIAAIREKVLPLLEEQLRLFEKKFPKEYEIVVNKLIEEKIKNSQEEIVNALYPSLGKMIKKFVTLQIQTVKDSVDDRLNNPFTTKGLIGKIKMSIFGIKESDTIFSDYQIQEVYLIQKNSGLLIGHASNKNTVDKNTVDKDLIAGMLTAIKAFGEDAFKGEQEDLESIQYGTYKIIIKSFYSYYIALAIEGSLSYAQQDKLGSRILDFAVLHLEKTGLDLNDKDIGRLSDILKKEFLDKKD